MKKASYILPFLAVFSGGIFGAISRTLIDALPLNTPFVNFFYTYLPMNVDVNQAQHSLLLSINNPLIWFIFFHFFPLEILLINIFGSFCIGIAIAYFTYTNTEQIIWRNFLITGFLGSFTTFSTFILDNMKLIMPLLAENLQNVFPKLAARTDVFNNLFHQTPFQNLEPNIILYLFGINIFSNIILCFFAVAIGHTITKKICTQRT